MFSSCQSVHVLRVGTWANVTDLCIASGGCRLWHHLSACQSALPDGGVVFLLPCCHMPSACHWAIVADFGTLFPIFSVSRSSTHSTQLPDIQSPKARRHRNPNSQIQTQKHSFINFRSIVTCVCSFLVSVCCSLDTQADVTRAGACGSCQINWPTCKRHSSWTKKCK